MSERIKNTMSIVTNIAVSQSYQGLFPTIMIGISLICPIGTFLLGWTSLG
jgi:hypothetical protein